MAASTYTETAIYTWFLTAFFDVPKNALMRRRYSIHLKSSSTCQRRRYSAGMLSAGKVN
jgi:hypothetical protein